MSVLLEKYSRAEILEAGLSMLFEATLLDDPYAMRVASGALLTVLIEHGVVSGADKPMKSDVFNELVDLVFRTPDAASHSEGSDTP